MTASLVIVSPLFPPARGGLADHTQRLARELAREIAVSVLASPGANVEEAFPVRAEIENWRDGAALLAALEKVSPTVPILWQYVPHMYGRGGVNLALPRTMVALRRQGRRQIVIAHEIAAPFSPWPQRFWYATAQRWQWQQMLRCVDGVGFSTESWLADWTRRAPGHRHKFFLAASPSSIPVSPVLQGHAQRWRQAHGLSADTRVMAYFGSLSAAKQFSWVTAAWKQSQHPDRPVALVVIGDRPDAVPPPELQELFKPLGFLPGPEVSAALHAVEVLALPFVDGVSERRTTFMAGLSHGCAVVTTVGHNTGPTLRQAQFLQGTSASDAASFRQTVAELLADDAGRKRLGEAGRRAYTQSYDWPVTLRTLTDQLRRISGRGTEG
ncbi:MAG: glycosyltransferase family 4 protein [Limisphaerales bacterium]